MRNRNRRGVFRTGTCVIGTAQRIKDRQGISVLFLVSV